ncbi:MAG: phosphate uptake regulator PhoU [Thaumarchaeota archaeon]|nr:MAG: phosphate uptake regulator PhoU [Nitrososphaerota archaeon]
MRQGGQLRKVQLTGGSTYIISLPKEWANDVGIKPGDYIQVIPQPDQTLLLVPGEKIEEKSEASIDATSAKSPEEVVREFIACYLTGYDIIRLKFGKRVDEYKARLKDIMRSKLIGLETIEESTNQMVVRCFLGYLDFPIKDALRRIHSMTLSMCLDAIRSLKDRDKSLAKDVVQRDDEIDRLYLFVVRGLKLAVENRFIMRQMGLMNPRECLGYRLIVKSIERIADHAGRIAGIILSLNLSKINNNLVKNLLNMAEKSYAIYQDAVNSFYKLDIEQANDSIMRVRELVKMEEDLVRKIFKLKLDVETITGLRLILESLKRIAEYAADIAEIVINLAIKPSC